MYRQLTEAERYLLSRHKGEGLSFRAIAHALGRSPSTISRELKRNASAHDGNYRSSHSVQKASGRKSRSRRNRPLWGR